MRILSFRLPDFEATIAKFNRKAVKWGLPEITYQITGTEVEERFEWIQDEFDVIPTKRVYHVEVTDLEIQGEIPRKGGWAIHSKIEPSGVPGKNFVFTTEGHANLNHLRTAKLFCEHCNAARLKARAYYIEHEDGRQMMVGADCLKDFLPGIAVEHLLAYMNAFQESKEYDEEEIGIAFENRVYPAFDAFMDAIVAIRMSGFVSKTKAQEGDGEATANFINPSPKMAVMMYDGVDIDALKIEAQACIDHLLAKNAEGNDFIYNIQLAIQAEYVKPKLYGYIAAGANVWMKDMEATREHKNRSNEHLGTVGVRKMFPNLKLIGVSITEGYYGNTYIHRFEDEAGNSLVWFGSKELDVKEGSIVNLKATIKSHDEYKGRKQTIITRCTPY